MKRYVAPIRPKTVNKEPSMTDQSQAAATDINNIVKQYLKTGDEAYLKRRAGQYADLTQIGDLAESLTQIELANEAFMELPSDLRLKLGNDPVQFIEWINDPQNVDEAVKHGFLVKREIIEDSTSRPTQISDEKTKKPKKQPDLPGTTDHGEQ